MNADRTSLAGSSGTHLCVVMGSHWAAQMGGAQYQVKCLLDVMHGKPDIRISYLARVTSPEFHTDAYDVIPFGSGKKRGTTGFLTDLSPLYTSLVSLRPNVVYQRGLKAYTGICALYCKRYDARLIFHVAHDDDVRPKESLGYSPRDLVSRIERKIGEYGLRHADAIVVQTRDQQELLASRYGLKARLVVSNFHPEPETHFDRPVGSKLRLIWVANFKPSKNPEIFVSIAEAFATRTDMEFIMIGRPGDPRKYLQLHDRISRLANLRYLGELPIDRVNEEIALSDVFVNTSTAEGFPNTFIQSWLRGVPVLSCWVDPDGCLARHGAGILAGGQEEMIATVDRLNSDRPLLERMRRTARAHVRANHGMTQAYALVDLITNADVAPDAGIRHTGASA